MFLVRALEAQGQVRCRQGGTRRRGGAGGSVVARARMALRARHTPRPGRTTRPGSTSARDDAVGDRRSARWTPRRTATPRATGRNWRSWRPRSPGPADGRRTRFRHRVGAIAGAGRCAGGAGARLDRRQSSGGGCGVVRRVPARAAVWAARPRRTGSPRTCGSAISTGASGESRRPARSMTRCWPSGRTATPTSSGASKPPPVWRNCQPSIAPDAAAGANRARAAVPPGESGVSPPIHLPHCRSAVRNSSSADCSTMLVSRAG